MKWAENDLTNLWMVVSEILHIVVSNFLKWKQGILVLFTSNACACAYVSFDHGFPAFLRILAVRCLTASNRKNAKSNCNGKPTNIESYFVVHEAPANKRLISNLETHKSRAPLPKNRLATR